MLNCSAELGIKMIRHFRSLERRKEALCVHNAQLCGECADPGLADGRFLLSRGEKGSGISRRRGTCTESTLNLLVNPRLPGMQRSSSTSINFRGVKTTLPRPDSLLKNSSLIFSISGGIVLRVELTWIYFRASSGKASVMEGLLSV